MRLLYRHAAFSLIQRMMMNYCCFFVVVLLLPRTHTHTQNNIDDGFESQAPSTDSPVLQKNLCLVSNLRERERERKKERFINQRLSI